MIYLYRIVIYKYTICIMVLLTNDISVWLYYLQMIYLYRSIIHEWYICIVVLLTNELSAL